MRTDTTRVFSRPPFSLAVRNAKMVLTSCYIPRRLRKGHLRRRQGHQTKLLDKNLPGPSHPRSNPRMRSTRKLTKPQLKGKQDKKPPFYQTHDQKMNMEDSLQKLNGHRERSVVMDDGGGGFRTAPRVSTGHSAVRDQKVVTSSAVTSRKIIFILVNGVALVDRCRLDVSIDEMDMLLEKHDKKKM